MEQRSDDGTNSVASTSGNGHVAIEMSIIEELDLRFGAAKNKHQILHSLEHCAVLHRIPLPNPSATSEQARKDFRRERVLLNDVPFIPDNIDVDRCNAFDKTLSILVDRMMRRKELYDGDLYSTSEAMTDAVLQRACRTSAGADSFFMVQKLLCVEGTFVTQRTYVSDPPIKIDVFVADPEVEGEYSYLTSSSSQRKLPSLPSRSASNNSSSTGIAMERGNSNSDANDGQRTPPATPPVGGKSKRSMPSPLKISLKNMGFVGKSSKPFQRSTSNGYDTSNNNNSNNISASASVSEHSSPAFTPPSTPPSTTTGGVHSFHNYAGEDTTGTSKAAGVGSICCRIQVMNSFAIYDVAAIEEITGVASQDPDPWLEVEAIVVDESNFKTDRHWRKLQLIATCPATGKVYTSSHDASSSSRHSGRLSGRMILQELTSWLTSFPSHLHHASHHHNHHDKEKDRDRDRDHHNHSHGKSSGSKDNHNNNSNNNGKDHHHTTTSHTRSETSPGVSVDVRDPNSSAASASASAVPRAASSSPGLSPGLSPSISPMSTSTHLLDCSFASFVSVTSAEAGASEFSPIDGPLSHAATLGTKGSNALSLQSAHEIELHAAALASLQQELDTPNSVNSAPHSLKYSTNPSPASPLKGLQVSSTDVADGHGYGVEYGYEHDQDQDQDHESLGRLTDHQQQQQQGLSRGDSLAQSDATGTSSDSAAGSSTSTGAVQGGPGGSAGAGRGQGSGGQGGLSGYGPGGIPLPVRTHEDLDLLIPSLRLLPGRGGGYSSDSSSTGDEGAWQDRDSRSNSSHSADALSSAAHGGSTSNAHSNSNSGHDGSLIALTDTSLE